MADDKKIIGPEAEKPVKEHSAKNLNVAVLAKQTRIPPKSQSSLRQNIPKDYSVNRYVRYKKFLPR